MNDSIKNREAALVSWAKTMLAQKNIVVELVSGDASFRRYYRILPAKGEQVNGSSSLIAVDSPVEQENNPLFVELAQLLNQHNINAPIVHYADYQQGFMLLSDLGHQHLADRIDKQNYYQQYTHAWHLINAIQNIPRSELTVIDAYSPQLIEFEMSLFVDWFLDKQLNIQLDSQQSQILNRTFAFLTQVFTEQPQVMVHRDFHSRNIMRPNDNTLGLIDFQGALMGPVTYDLVSLLKDCYLVWPAEQVSQLADEFRQAYYADIEPLKWAKWFDLTGLQRHIKCAGIFARLAYRDNKPNYLQYTDNVLNYIIEAAQGYPELIDFYTLMTQTILPTYRVSSVAQEHKD